MCTGTLRAVTTAEAMAAIADRLEQDIDAVVAEMDAAVVAATPLMGDDPAITAEVSASNRANLRRFLTFARHVDDPPPVEVPPEALDIARTLVRRGIETDAAYHSYRRGQQAAWRRWMVCAEETAGSGAGFAAILSTSHGMLFEYVEEVLGRVVAEMQREREELLGGALARRTETVRLILDDAPLDEAGASRRLRYDLARRHTGLVLWTESAAAAQGTLESAALALAREAGARRPLTLAAGVATLWAWIGTDGEVTGSDLEVALAQTDASVRIAAGPTRTGIVGFRRSHEAALSVHRLLAGNPEGGRLATYEQLEVTALAAHDERRARDFVAATLGSLADDKSAAARLRETLRVFLEEAENAPRAAARLHTHRNTVLQRVARATDLLGHRPGERRLAVELALELRRRLGPARPEPGPARH